MPENARARDLYSIFSVNAALPFSVCLSMGALGHIMITINARKMREKCDNFVFS